MKKIIVTEYEKKQDMADRNLYKAARVLKASGLDDQCLKSAKKELRSRIKLEADIDRMEIRTMGRDVLDNWQKVKYPGMTKKQAMANFKRVMYHGRKKHGWHSVKTKWVKQNGVWVSYEHFTYTK